MKTVKVKGVVAGGDPLYVGMTTYETNRKYLRRGAAPYDDPTTVHMITNATLFPTVREVCREIGCSKCASYTVGRVVEVPAEKVEVPLKDALNANKAQFVLKLEHYFLKFKENGGHGEYVLTNYLESATLFDHLDTLPGNVLEAAAKIDRSKDGDLKEYFIRGVVERPAYTAAVTLDDWIANPGYLKVP